MFERKKNTKNISFYFGKKKLKEINEAEEYEVEKYKNEIKINK